MTTARLPSANVNRSTALMRALTLTTALWGCSGAIEATDPAEPTVPSSAGPGPSPSSPPGQTPTTPSTPTTGACRVTPGASVVRLLSRAEYDATVLDLLGDDGKHAQDFPAEARGKGFSTSAGADVNDTQVDKFRAAAETIAQRAGARLATLLPCSAQGDDACAAGFIDGFGARAWRRPLEAAAKTRLMTVFTSGKALGGFRTGIEMVIETLLQSPRFLYRIEKGVPVAGGPTRLDDWEVAARLSYLLTGSMPDDALRAAAAKGTLSSPAQIADQARRLLATPRSRALVGRFHAEWLQLGHVDTLEKNRAVFPAFDPALRAQLRAETETFIDQVLYEGTGGWRTLLNANFTFVNGPVAAHYAWKAPAGEGFQKVTLPAGQRVGLLTHAGLMAALANPNQTSPVLRGGFVREQLLCTPLPVPPPELEVSPPELDPKLTTRERFSQHAKDPSCEGCHRLMDPIGLAFERYDGVGAYRPTESGKPVDDSGQLFSTDVDGPFSGAVGLVERLTRSAQVERCVATQWFRFATGRHEDETDACTIQTLVNAMGAAGDPRQLLLAFVQSDAFRFRAGGSP